MKSGRLTIAWYRNRPSPTTPGWLRSWARNISTMLGYKSDGRVEVVVIWCTKHWPSVAILRVANGLNYSDPWGEDRGQMSSTASRQEEKSHPTTSHRCFLQMAFFYNLVSNGEIFPMFVYFNK
uniref:(northern house mosquito) hypothetical protein n=1 Tax=Culex pipiens TaxID=7175 RepID=A0A8D8FML5_CULPI